MGIFIFFFFTERLLLNLSPDIGTVSFLHQSLLRTAPAANQQNFIKREKKLTPQNESLPVASYSLWPGKMLVSQCKPDTPTRVDLHLLVSRHARWQVPPSLGSRTWVLRGISPPGAHPLAGVTSAAFLARRGCSHTGVAPKSPPIKHSDIPSAAQCSRLWCLGHLIIFYRL